MKVPCPNCGGVVSGPRGVDPLPEHLKDYCPAPPPFKEPVKRTSIASKVQRRPPRRRGGKP
jgi:hypothetical protein